jgi:hypothetical protein
VHGSPYRDCPPCCTEAVSWLCQVLLQDNSQRRVRSAEVCPGSSCSRSDRRRQQAPSEDMIVLTSRQAYLIAGAGSCCNQAPCRQRRSCQRSWAACAPGRQRSRRPATRALGLTMLMSCCVLTVRASAATGYGPCCSVPHTICAVKGTGIPHRGPAMRTCRKTFYDVESAFCRSFWAHARSISLHCCSGQTMLRPVVLHTSSASSKTICNS